MAITDDYSRTYKVRHVNWAGGQRDEVKPTLLSEGESVTLTDVTLDQAGTLYPSPGHKARYASPGATKVDGLGYYEKSTGARYLLVAIGTALYYDDLSSAAPALVQITGTFSASVLWDFTVFNDKVYITNGIDALKTWDGTTLVVLTVTYIFSHTDVHTNMLWGVEAGTSRLRWSAILDGATWDASNFMDFNSMDGDFIRRMIRFTSYLFVAKRRSKAYLTGDRTSNYAYTWLEGIGTIGMNAVDVVDRYVAYIASDGIHLTDFNTDTLISSKLNEAWRTRVNKNALSGAALVHWRNYVVVSLPVDGSTVNNTVWYYDMRSHAWVTLTNLNIACFTKAYLNGDEVLYGADNTKGQVIQLFNYGYLYYPDGLNLMQYTWKSKDWTEGQPERYKLYKNIYLELEGVEELSRINMWIYIDDVEYEVATEAINVPDGVGLYRHVRLIPPIYGAVLGTKLAVKLSGRVGVRSVTVEYALRSNVPPGGVI